MPDPTIDKLKDRIEVLESALKEIDLITADKRISTAYLNSEKIHEIATKALWPV